jgi:hypothetical protein
MAKDVLITPASGLIQFKDAGNNVDATIQLDDANVLNISGTISLGDLAANVYIGDGVNSVDIIFEQNGAVRALAGKTLTLGQANSNISFAGNITSGANITGNVTAGNLITLGAVTGNARAVTSLNASNIDTGTLPSARLSGTYTITVSGAATTASTVTTAAQPNITSVGTLSSLSVTGNVTGGNIAVTNVTGTGSLNTAGNINFTNAEATDSAKLYADVSVATTSLVLEVSDDLASDRIVLRHRYFSTANTVDMLSAQLSNNTEANVTVTGNLITTNRVVASGNVTGGNITTAGLISATGNITAVGNIQGNYFVGNGSLLTGIAGSGAGGTFQVIARSGSITVVVASGFFSVVTRNSGSRQVAVA